MTRYPYITRLDNASAHGWWVRIYRGGGAQKLFSDGVHGGREKALKAAIKWRDEKLVGLAPTSRRRYGKGDGYIRKGTRFYRRRDGSVSEPYAVWLAWIRVDEKRNKNAQTSFAIKNWTNRGARREAVRWFNRRRAKLGLPPVSPEVRR